MFQQDWLMRQIEMAVQFIIKVLFGAEKLDEEFIDETRHSDTDGLLPRLLKMVDNGRINDAENLLFDYVEKQKPHTLRTAIVFYDTLNNMDDTELERCDFSREEVLRGLSDVTRRYGLNIMDLYQLD